MDARKQAPADVPQILKAEVKGKGKKNPATTSELARPAIPGCKGPSGASCGEGTAKVGRVSGQKRSREVKGEDEEDVKASDERRSREKKVPVVVLDSDDDELDLEKQQPPVVQEKKATPADVRAKKRAPAVTIEKEEESLPPLQFTAEKEKKKKQAGIEAKPQREEAAVEVAIKAEEEEEDFNIISDEDYFEEEDEDEDYDSDYSVEEEEDDDDDDDFNTISEEDYLEEEDEDEDYGSDYSEEEEEEDLEEPVVQEQQELAPVDDIVRVRNFEGLHILADVVTTEDARVASRTRLRKGSRRSSEHSESDGKFSQPIQIDVSPSQCSPVDISSDSSSDSEGKGE